MLDLSNRDPDFPAYPLVVRKHGVTACHRRWTHVRLTNTEIPKEPVSCKSECKPVGYF